MYRNVVYWSPLYSTKKMFLFKPNKLVNSVLHFKWPLLSSHKISLPPMKLLTTGLQQRPPPFFPDPPNYSFLVALCFGFLVIFNRK